ncbi:hypothetical protein CR513_13740, partial [Mucuna pruriens]
MHLVKDVKDTILILIIFLNNFYGVGARGNKKYIGLRGKICVKIKRWMVKNLRAFNLALLGKWFENEVEIKNIFVVYAYTYGRLGPLRSKSLGWWKDICSLEKPTKNLRRNNFQTRCYGKQKVGLTLFYFIIGWRGEC